MFLSHLPEMHEPYDVVVIGAGMVGAPLALSLQKAGFSTLVIEKQSLDTAGSSLDAKSFDRRATAMSLGSIEILQSFGLWDEEVLDATPIKHVHVSESGKLGTTRLDAEALGVEQLGAVVSNNSFGNVLLAQLKNASLGVLDQCEVISLEVREAAAELNVARNGQQKKISAKLLIAVDGANSATAKLLGIQVRHKPYSQHALIANVETELANEGVAFERFSTPGPIAMLPIEARESALVWTLPDDQIKAHMSMNEVEFCDVLTQVFGERLGRILRCGERVAYPLVLSQAQEVSRSRVLLAGNAAHSLHPVAGQGFNLALRGVAAVVEHLTAARAMDCDFASLAVLQAYGSQHQTEQFKIVSFSDQIIELFSENSSIPAWARSLGLVGLNNLDGLKREFARHAMGRSQKIHSLRADGI